MVTSEAEYHPYWNTEQGYHEALSRLDTALREAAEEVAACNQEKGWYEDKRSFGDEMMLVVTECAEALEAYRDFEFREFYRRPNGEFSESPVNEEQTFNKPEGVAIEIADAFIRILDSCKRHNINLASAFRTKENYNWTRPYRHGGKAL